MLYKFIFLPLAAWSVCTKIHRPLSLYLKRKKNSQELMKTSKKQFNKKLPVKWIPESSLSEKEGKVRYLMEEQVLSHYVLY